LATSSIRVLVVDDVEDFRRFICSTLRDKLELRTIHEESDGVGAVAAAHLLQPDLIVLDIGLPKLNGIEAARRIRELAPQSRILFVSQESSVEIVQAAFGAGASGYVVKMDAGRELQTAVSDVLRGEKFVGARFAGHGFTAQRHARTPGSLPGNRVVASLRRPDIETDHHHEAGFYPDDASFLERFTQFIGAALRAGNAVIVLATESHRDSLQWRLQTHGLDVDAAVEQGRYIALDAADTLSTFMINDLPDPVRLFKAVGDLFTNAAKAAKGEHPRVAACGECAPLLWAQGKGEAAIRLEQLWNEVVAKYDMNTLCGYPLGSFDGEIDNYIFQQICAEHSGVHSG
jgi:DNA-binding NarL/FixJ family response regulator